MEIYLAAISNTSHVHPTITKDILKDVNILESFYYIKDIMIKNIKNTRSFMLDSGAFTFFSSNTKKNDWDLYIEKYCNFINQNNVKLFFELDIDPIVGYDKVKKIRREIERRCQKQPIPVWHRSRGKNEFFKMCDEYPYVALGGLAAKEIKKDEYKYIPWFINEAHKRQCKIHGLGFTSVPLLQKYHFDSVDSSTWTIGNRCGCAYRYNDGKITRIFRNGTQRVKHIEVAKQNFLAWAEYSKWARTHL